MLALPARAKLNLDLHVAGRRPDGFHDLVTTMQSIELHDLLTVERFATTELSIDGLPVDRSGNSVLQAQSVLERAAQKALPARFHLHKRIPPGSGMGGASSDAAAALIALKRMYALDLDLAPVAAEVGADVPFFLRGGCMTAEGRGERLTPLPVEPAWFAVAWPGIELSTAAVYRAWDEVGGEGENELRRAAEKVDPHVGDFARRLGDGWRMTGSGSAFFLRCASEKEALQATEGLACWTAVTPAVGQWG